MMSADDLQYFLAVARHGRIVRAAEELQVDHTTVGRRINALERSLGQRLFDRNSRGWKLTEPGRRLLPPAEQVMAAVDLANETVGPQGARLTGSVRILTPDGFGTFLLAPSLGRLRERHPDLTIELVTATVHLGQSARTFDLAVTLEEPTSDRVETRKLARYSIGLYASADYLARNSRPESVAELREHDLIWYVDQLLDVEPMRQVRETFPIPAAIQSTNLIVHWQAAAAGVGIAPIPNFIARHDSRLIPVLPELEFFANFWLVLPREHRRLARVHAVIDTIDHMLRERRHDLAGREEL